MSAHFPDHDIVRAVLSLATRAPSVHNTQPWRWRVGLDSLHLYADRSLQLSSADPDGRDLILSCGIALHHCVVALAALGWQTKVHRRPNLDDSEHLAAIEVYPQPPNEVDVSLAAAIPHRQHRPTPLQRLGRPSQLHRPDGCACSACRGDAAPARIIATTARNSGASGVATRGRSTTT